MKTYEVVVTETLQRTITINADNEGEALDKVQEMYDNEDIVLSADDYQDTEIEVVEDDN